MKGKPSGIRTEGGSVNGGAGEEARYSSWATTWSVLTAVGKARAAISGSKNLLKIKS